MTTVLILTAKGCIDCVRVKGIIIQASVEAHVPVTFKEMDIGSPEATDKALLYGMNSVPSFVVKGKVFNTANPNLKDLVSALKSKAV